MCVYCAFAQKQQQPDSPIIELKQALSSIIREFQDNFSQKFNNTSEQVSKIEQALNEVKETQMRKVEDKYHQILSALNNHKQQLLTKIQKDTDRFTQEIGELKEQTKFKQTKFKRYILGRDLGNSLCRFIQETQSVVQNVEAKGMDKNEFEKVQEVYAVVLEDLHKWEEIRNGLGQEFEVTEFEENKEEVVLGKLKQAKIR